MDFSQVEAQYTRLKAQFAAGALSEADFKARLQGLMIEDEQGRWWIIGYETGQWYVHDGEQWVPGQPPRPAAEASAPQAEAEPKQPSVEPPRPAPKRQAKAKREEPAVAPPRAEKPQAAQASQPGGRRPWLWVAAGVAGLALVALLIRQVGQGGSTPTAEPAPMPAPTGAGAPARAPAATEVRAPSAPPAGVVSSLVAPSCDYGGELKSIEALDDFTVRFTLCYSDVAFPAKAALPPFGIHPAEYLAATGGTDQLLREPIGTGPYRLDSGSAGELHLEAYPDYWGQPAKIAHVQFHWLDDASERLGYLKTGDVDGIDNPPPETYAEIQSDSNLGFYPRDGLNIGYLGFSNLVKPFDDVRVRRAVALAIDRSAQVKKLYPAGTIVATHFTPCAIPGGCSGETWYDFDPDMARMLLAEAGYPDGFETELFYRDSVRSYLPNPAQTAQDMAQMLERFLNIRVKLTATEMDSATFRDAAWQGDFPLYLSGWDIDFPDPVSFLSPHWSAFSSNRFETGFPEIWEGLKQATLTASPEKRIELYTQANNLIKRDVPVAPLVHVGSATAFRANVSGAHSSPLYLESFAAMALPEGQSTLVWKQAAGPQSLYCADETEADAWRACAQMTESLLGFKAGSIEVTPALAESYTSNADLTEWTFHLRKNVKFHDGSLLDARDVVTSWVVQWDAQNPLHRGRTGAFDDFLWLFNAFLHAEK